VRLTHRAFLILGGVALVALNSGAGPALSVNAASAVRAEKIIFRDGFRKAKGGWATGSNAHETAGYLQGSLFIEMKKAREGYSALATKAPPAGNMLVEVSARNVSGRSDARFGVDCRSNYSKKPPYRDLGYTFSIYNDGSFAIERSEAQRVKLLAQGQSAKIAGGRSSYKIGASCLGSRLTLIVDGRPIASATDRTYTRGRYGVFVWVDQGGKVPATVRFTNFVVRQPG